MFKKTFAATGLTVGAAAGALFLSTPAHADEQTDAPQNVIIIYNTNTNTNTNNNSATATVSVPGLLSLLEL
ncbi:hypothetical protein Arub01_02500 [Actinomadura rubrobrunea]|uniref:Uncharacterized protein n=1 Tax=Actinomadura rubrobrunea TaxID=115335 RepID=A0A9W6PRP7_9ACTN|nr:hypothetical protein [Actinomadura rubrobrunea]GLW62006.1 hypothetical protein Arub01_02500 [Actinomadura rubrobrunea]